VVWGGNGAGLESHRWIHRSFHLTARKIGIPSVWLFDSWSGADALRAGDTVIAANIWSEHLPYVEGVDYVLHNFSGSDPLPQALEDTPEHLLRLQVWTHDATGEEWDQCRQFDRDARTLFQPWGSDLLPEEFLEPVFNPQSRDVVFVGAIWSDQYQGRELGNVAMIEELKRLCMRHRLTFKHLTHIPDAQMVAETRAARLAPAFAGNWQVEHGYLPCRAFKVPAYGALAVCNVPTVQNLNLASMKRTTDIGELFEDALTIKRGSYLNLVREQQRVVSKYTYRSSLEAIDRALQEIKA
jgi:hypothetical protein